MWGVDLLRLREAIAASWDAETSYCQMMKPGNPAYGQSYPTAKVIQHFFPEAEIAAGEVWTGQGAENHFWNVVDHEGTPLHINLSWQQFPIGSSVMTYAIRDRSTLADSLETIMRVKILLNRVEALLS